MTLQDWLIDNTAPRPLWHKWTSSTDVDIGYGSSDKQIERYIETQRKAYYEEWFKYLKETEDFFFV